MRVALGVFRTDADRSVNRARMTGLCQRAAHRRADLVVFAETALTGFAAAESAPGDRAAVGEPQAELERAAGRGRFLVPARDVRPDEPGHHELEPVAEGGQAGATAGARWAAIGACGPGDLVLAGECA